MKYTIIRDNIKKPTGNRKEDAGVDFYIPNDWNNGKPYKLYLNHQVIIGSGIKVKVPYGYELKNDNKSGIAAKKGLVVGATIIDTSYRGEVYLNLFKVAIGSEDKRNWLGHYYTLLIPGEKISQGTLVKISTENWEEISNKEYEKGPKTKRSTGSFGSSGRFKHNN